MLKIKDKNGRTKFVLRDEDEEPVSIDELILADQKQEKDDAESNTGRSNARSSDSQE